MTAAPLRGIRVADFSRILAGPFATMVLGDLGADVVKVERPGTGDDTRDWGPPFLGGDAAYFLSTNRNKQSVVLDLMDPTDAGVARELIRSSDVVIENFRSGVMSRLGLDYEAARELNPSVVYCSIPAFSNEEMEDRPGYDLMMQAFSGFMSITGEDGGAPLKMGVALLDVVAGLFASTAILAALRERDVSGVGRRVTVSLFDTSVAALVNQAANYLVGGMLPHRTGNAHPNIVPYQAFETRDGPLVLAAGNDKLFRITCEVLGRPELADDPRFRSNGGRVDHRDELVELLSEAFAQETVAVWLERLQAQGVPCAPVRGLDEVFASPEGRGMIQTIEDPARGPFEVVASPFLFSVDGGVARRPAPTLPPPLLGEHDERIRRELGRDEEEQS